MDVTTILLGAMLVYVAVGATWTNLVTVEYRVLALIVMAGSAVAWLVLRRRGHWNWHRTSLDPVLSFWAVAFGVSLLANLDAWRRISIGLWFAGLYILIWYALHDALGNRRITRAALIDSLLVVGVVIVSAGYVELFQSLRANPAAFPRVRSSLENPNTLATALLVLTPLAAARCLTLRGWLRVVVGIYSVISACLLFLTLTRGAWLAAGVSLPLLALLLLVHFGVRVNRYLVGGLAAVALLSVLGISLARGWALEGRTEIYTAAIQMFQEKPISGYGLFTYGRGLLRLVGVLPGETTHSQAHDIVLNIAAELGVVGLAALAATLFVFFRDMARNWRAAQDQEQILVTGGISAVVGFGCHLIFDVTASLPAVALVGLIGFVVALAPVSPALAPPSRLRSYLAVALVVLLVVTGVLDTTIYRIYMAGLDDAVNGNLKAAVQEVQQASDADPSQPVYQLHRAFLLDATGQRDAAQRAFETVCRLEPNYAQAPYDTQMARLHFFNLSLVTPSIFWYVYQCPRPGG